VLGGVLLGQRLREPLAGIDLALRSRRAQLVDREPGRDRREVRLRRLRRGLSRVVAEEGLLHDVLGVSDRPEHPVRDREQVRPQLLLPLHAQ
jgi:hypothetical protein